MSTRTSETRVTDATQSKNDQRLYVESGVAGEIAALAEPVIEDLGFRLVRVVISGRDGGTLQIMAERADGTLTIADCTKISRNLSPVLDVADPISNNYRLEISSPGIDRPLVRRIDFENWAGREIKIETSELIDGRRRFRGVLEGVEGGEIRLALDKKEIGEEVTVGLPFELIAQAKLMMNDSLLKVDTGTGTGTGTDTGADAGDAKPGGSDK